MHRSRNAMTNKYVFDASSRTRMRVVGQAHTWEQLSSDVRVRRKVVGPQGSYDVTEHESWSSPLDWDFELMLLEL